MSHLYLPAEHTDTDLALASAVAEAIDSNELFVAWTCDGGTAAAPEVKALLRRLPEPELRSPFAEAMSEIGGALRAFVRLVFFRRAPRPAKANPPVRASRSELEEAA
jgi:hypothetical protein